MTSNAIAITDSKQKALKRFRSPSFDQDHRIIGTSDGRNHGVLQTPDGKLIKTGDYSAASVILSDHGADVESIIDEESDFLIINNCKLAMFHHDPRKRRDALLNLIKVSHCIDFTMYPELSEALHDDYERCRSLAINLILIMSSKYGDCLVFQKNLGDDQIRLEDDAFVKICRMITDSAVQVRTDAARALSKFTSVKVDFLLATLDKKLDGAFVFGLEDERKDVRLAALESLCQLSKNEPRFAEKSIDHIVDMFNDEIEDIRLKAIQCLQEIGDVALREDQVDVILTVLDSPLMDIREAMHKMLAVVNITSARSLRRCIESVLYNLVRYPQDRLSIFECFKLLGRNLSELVAVLVSELLAIHPYLKLPEHSLIDDNYIATLILVFNATSKTPTILKCLESHTLQHETYIRHTLPNFMPPLKNMETSVVTQSTSALFFVTIFNRLSRMLKSKNTLRSKISLMEMSLKDLKSFGLVEPKFKASTEFYRVVIESILIIIQVLATQNWSDSSSSLVLIRKVLDQTFSLLKRYHKLSTIQRCCIQQLRIQTLAIELVIFIKSCGNNLALDLCDDFIEEVRSLESYLSDQPFLDSIAMGELSSKIPEELNESLKQNKENKDTASTPTDAVAIAKRLEPLFNRTSFSINQIIDTLILLIESQDIDELRKMKTSRATINDSSYKNDTAYKFTAGLVLELTLDALVENVTNIDDIRVKVSYPDKQAHIIVPISNHFRLISSDKHSETSSYRLYSTVNICHNFWTNPSSIELSLVLDYRDNQTTSISENHLSSSMTILTTSSSTTISASTTTKLAEKNQIIDLCRPLYLKIHPHSSRW